MLGSGELLRISRLLETAGACKSLWHDMTMPMRLADCLDGYFEQLNPVTTLCKSRSARCIIDEDEISDDASPATETYPPRQSNQINDKVHATLSSMVNGSLRTYLQDPIITMRGDRYCIPVKAEYRSQVTGYDPRSVLHRFHTCSSNQWLS